MATDWRDHRFVEVEMADAEELVELLRSTARFKYGTTAAADLMLEAADMIERQHAALMTILFNLHPKNKPPDSKWVMDRAFETAQRGLMITSAPAA